MDLVLHVRLLAAGGWSKFAVALLAFALVSRTLRHLRGVTLVALVPFLPLAAAPVAASAATATPALLVFAIAIGMRRAAFGMTFAEVLLSHGTFRHRLVIVGRSKARWLIAAVLLGTEFARLMPAELAGAFVMALAVMWLLIRVTAFAAFTATATTAAPPPAAA